MYYSFLHRRPAPPSDVTVEKAEEEKEEDEDDVPKRSRFIARRNSHVPDVPNFVSTCFIHLFNA